MLPTLSQSTNMWDQINYHYFTHQYCSCALLEAVTNISTMKPQYQYSMKNVINQN